MAALASIGTLIAGIALAVALFATGHWVLGFFAFLGILPVTVAVWVMMRDRL